MVLLEVNNKETINLFHEVPIRIYKNDPDWIPHIVKEIEYIFDSIQNGVFTIGDAKRWILYNEDFEPVGRIAAFYNKNEGNQLIGGIGFYECLNIDAYAEKLFNQAENWLESNGVLEIEGPINFGERHQFWGCMSIGNAMPVYQENYNPIYYNAQFIQNGYYPYFESLSYEITPGKMPFKRIENLYERVKVKEFEFVKFKNEDTEKFVNDYLEIASKTFKQVNRIVKIDKNSILNLLNIQKGVLKENFIWFAYQNNKPIGVLGFMYNWSGILNSALNFKGKTKYKSLKGFLLAVLPEYHNKGVLIGLINHLTGEVLIEKEINKVFICGVAGYSQNVHSFLRKLNAEVIEKHITYKKLFNGEKVEPFQN